MPRRWPLHPPPYPGEALSSWVSRLARALAVPPAVLLRHHASSHPQTLTGYHLDFDSPEHVLLSLAEGTGQPLGAVRRLTVRGYVPSLLDTLDVTPNGVAQYTRALALLLPVEYRSSRHPPLLPWYSLRRFRQLVGCRNCLAEDAEPYLRLHWRFPWMFTCPIHQRMLEPFAMHVSAAGITQITWVYDQAYLPVPSSPLLTLDAITLQAITGGICDLPCGKVPAALWIRLLRTVLDELAVGIGDAGSYGETLMRLWSSVERGYGFYLLPWRPYEKLDHDYQKLFMRMAANAFTDAFEQPHPRQRIIDMAHAHRHTFPLPVPVPRVSIARADQTY